MHYYRQRMEISESMSAAAPRIRKMCVVQLTWGVAGLLESDDRLKWDAWLQEMDSDQQTCLYVSRAENPFSSTD